MRGSNAAGRLGEIGRVTDDLGRDLRYALRALRRAPGFTAAATLTLALGIGAVTIIYSVVHHVVVDPLPYRDSDRLVNVIVEDVPTGRPRTTFSSAEFIELRDRSQVFEDVIGTLGQGMRYETADGAEYLRAVWVTPNFFDFMGLQPLLGRAIGPQDGRPGAPPVAVLRHRAWVTYFGGSPDVVGRTIILNGQPRTLVGVMPPRFTWHAADLWIAAAVTPGDTSGGPPARNFQARLKPGVTLAEAEAQLNVIVDGRAREHPAEYPQHRRTRVVNVIAYTVGPFSAILYTTLAAVGLLLVIACCNVANMLLARGTAREREVMVRLALGAGRTRIVRQLMVESVLLALCGATLGCALAFAGIDVLVARLPQGPLPGEVDIRLNGPVLVFTLLTSCVSAILFGLAPAIYTARRDLVDGGLRGGARVAGTRRRLRGALVVAEVALSLVLVLAAGVLTRTFLAVTRVDLGFTPDGVLVVPLAFPAGRYTEPAEKSRFYRQALDRIGTLSGVRAVGAATGIPPFDAGTPVIVGAGGSSTEGLPRAALQLVTPDYFKALGIGLVRGRGLPDSLPGRSVRQAVVNETFARLYVPGGDPVGRTLVFSPVTGPADPSRHGAFEIVGVARDVRNRGLRGIEPQVYVPWSGPAPGSALLLVSTGSDSRQTLGMIRRELAVVDRQVAAAQSRTLSELLELGFFAQPRFSLLVLGLFAVTGTLLVAIGVYSVMAYTVTQQTREIAVRIALGASAGRIHRGILGAGARMLAIGVGLGLLCGLATNRLLAAQLWSVSPNDPLTLAAGTLVVSAIALAACYLPARRATRVDPGAALRVE